jgi:hypothetical protein
MESTFEKVVKEVISRMEDEALKGVPNDGLENLKKQLQTRVEASQDSLKKIEAEFARRAGAAAETDKAVATGAGETETPVGGGRFRPGWLVAA